MAGIEHTIITIHPCTPPTELLRSLPEAWFEFNVNGPKYNQENHLKLFWLTFWLQKERCEKDLHWNIFEDIEKMNNYITDGQVTSWENYST